MDGSPESPRHALVAPLAQGLLPSELFKPTALELPDNLTFDQWDAIGNLLGHMDGAIAFWWGDFCLYGETHYGEAWASARAFSGRQYKTIANWVYVARMFRDSSRRRENLSWGHHAEVAGLKLPRHTKDVPAPDVQAQDEWLDRAARGDGGGEPWTRARLREELAKARGRRPWDLDEALDRLEAAMRAIAKRWPTGRKAREALGRKLMALGERVLSGEGVDLGA